MTRRRTLSAVTAILLVVAVQILGCRLPSPSTPTSFPSVSLLDTNEPYLISGEIPYTSPFFVWGLGDAFVLLEDQAGFVNRDLEFEFPLAGQVLGVRGAENHPFPLHQLQRHGSLTSGVHSCTLS